MKKILVICLMIIGAIGIGFYLGQDKEKEKVGLDDPGEIPNFESNSEKVEDKTKTKDEFIPIKIIEPKDRRCRVEGKKRRVDCTQTEYEKYEKKRLAIKEQKKKDSEYQPDEFIDYEKGLIQPYTIIDEDEVGWTINMVSIMADIENKDIEIKNYTPIFFNTKKFYADFSKERLKEVIFKMPNKRERIVFRYDKRLEQNELSDGRRTISMVNSKTGGSLFFFYNPKDNSLSGSFSHMGNANLVEIKNNKGYIYNAFNY